MQQRSLLRGCRTKSLLVRAEISELHKSSGATRGLNNLSISHKGRKKEYQDLKC